ncbi:MAG: hypothetical protein Ct9H300mP28_16010 [Pseudomonadota bacterium]|nr:MAG: hypothetical protein Ct9H300mP28_16010 [Pseudomonadota bacterium]
MLSPVAVSWMIGKSLMEYRFGPAATLHVNWDGKHRLFFSTTEIAKIKHDDPWMHGPSFPL